MLNVYDNVIVGFFTLKQVRSHVENIAMKSGAPQRIIRPVWRWCLALASLVILILEYVSYEVTRSINGYYFKDYSSPAFGAAGIAVIVLAIYLLVVAIAGRWLPFRKAP